MYRGVDMGVDLHVQDLHGPAYRQGCGPHMQGDRL